MVAVMHSNPAFRATTRDSNIDFARSRGFGMLAVSHEERVLVSHIPFVLNDAGTSVEGHLAKNNPIVAMLNRSRPATLVISGSDSYVSPDWYGSPGNVPTWNYIAVHLRGVLTLGDSEALPQHLNRLSHHFETQIPGKAPWTPAQLEPSALQRMARAIVAITLDVEVVEGTWKLSQNKDPDARNHAAAEISRNSLGQETGVLAQSMDSGTVSSKPERS